MNVPKELHYTKSHEWICVDGDVVTIGITDFAQAQLSDLTYVELPGEGDDVAVIDILLTLNNDACVTTEACFDLQKTLRTETSLDLDLVRGPGEGRRRYLDFLGSQLGLDYRRDLSRYRRALKARNLLLKDRHPDEAQIAGLR